MIQNLENEIWKDIKGYEGLYQISNKGRIKSLFRQYRCGEYHAVLINKPEMILRQSVSKKGYNRTCLTLGGIKNTIITHREVAKAFIQNPENKPEVNHINGIKTDNRVENLEWVTTSENIQHAYKILKRKGSSQGKKYENHFNSKKVAQYDRKGNLIKLWSSAAEAGEIGGFHHSGVSCVCRGITKTHKGYIWKFI